LLRADDNDFDGVGDFWALGRQELPFDGRTFTMEIRDEDRLLPLNKLGGTGQESDTWARVVKRLVGRAGLPPEEAVDSLSDWMDPDTLRRPSGAEQGDYGPRFMVKNAPLDSLDELEGLRGWSPPRLTRPPEMNLDPLKNLLGDRPEFQKIQEMRGLGEVELEKPPTGPTGEDQEDSRWSDWLTVWSGGKVNLNTAPAEVLRSLDDSMSDVTVQEILTKRELDPLRSEQDLKELPGMNSDLAYRLSGLAGYTSTFFRITVGIDERPGRMTLEAVVRREGANLKVVEWTVR
ncbi:MAG: type II secretion system protein GspK, partial [Candidatus Eremiobacterota bacterium]